jgi:hypothetical protein
MKPYKFTNPTNPTNPTGPSKFTNPTNPTDPSKFTNPTKRSSSRRLDQTVNSSIFFEFPTWYAPEKLDFFGFF